MTTITEIKNNINKSTISCKKYSNENKHDKSTTNEPNDDIQDFGSSDDEPIMKNKKYSKIESNFNISPTHLVTNSDNCSINTHPTDLVSRKINDNYSIGKYYYFDVTIHTNTGYINATKLCADGGKQLKDWFMNDCNKELVESYIKLININTLTYSINGGNITQTSGTYVHPKLITHITSWVYPYFAWKVS